jgi:hypothetical protein
LILHCKNGKGNNPPQQEHGDDSIGNSIQKSQAFVRPEIVEGKDEGRNDQKGQVTDHEERIDRERIDNDSQSKQMKRMEEIQKDKIDDR